MMGHNSPADNPVPASPSGISPRRRRFALPLLGCLLVIVLAAGLWARRAAPPVPVVLPTGTALPPAALKIITQASGVYRLRSEELRAAGLEDVLKDPARLRLLYRGQAVPFWLIADGADQALSFYARPSQSLYSLENVYWLVYGDFPLPGGESDTLPETPAAPDSELLERYAASAPRGAYYAVLALEENLLYQPQVEAGDHWLWIAFPAPALQSFDLPIGQLATGPENTASARLRVSLWASTEASAAPDHHILVRLNGELVADDSWDGKGYHLIEAEFPAARLMEGTNTLQIEAPGDLGLAAEIATLNWIQLDYPRQLLAAEDRLDFWSAGGEQALAGFSGPVELFDITDPERPLRLAEADQGGNNRPGELVFTAQDARRYWAAGPAGFLTPLRLVPAALAPDLRAPGSGGDYLAIGPADLLEPLAPLLTLRQSQNLTARSIPIELIYDQFNFGLPEPQAIQAFMRYAVESWSPAPRYLLLLGDATYDPRGYLAPPEANRLPTFLVDTVFGGQTASDVGFVQLNADPWPDLAVGRIPARNPEQVRLLVEKILSFERSLTDGGSQPGLLAVADGQEPVFRSDAQAFLDLFGEAYDKELFAPQAGASGANQQIIDYLAAGDLLVAYFGHGSVNMWGKDKLFTTQDVAGLRSQAQFPVVLNFTCLTGLFTHPKVESLAEALLWQPGGGAVAVLAPSSLTLPSDQSFLTQALATQLQSNGENTLGMAHMAARRQIPGDSPGALDVMQTFMLFGDPALRLPEP